MLSEAPAALQNPSSGRPPHRVPGVRGARDCGHGGGGDYGYDGDADDGDFVLDVDADRVLNPTGSNR